MDDPDRSLILASASPRRQRLLREAGYVFAQAVPDVDEAPLPNETPERMVERLARLKAETVAQRFGPENVVLAADTIVVVDGTVLGKPRDEADATRMLLQLAGKTQRVLTGYALRSAQQTYSGVEESRVRMRAVEPSEARAYAASGEPLDKAGAWALQGQGARFVEAVDGSRSNVIGLPIEVVVPLLARCGVRPA